MIHHLNPGAYVGFPDGLELIHKLNKDYNKGVISDKILASEADP